MERETQELLRELGRKLDMVAALLLRSVPRNIEGLSLKEQIKLLDGLSIRPVEIAKIVGKSSGHVNKELVAIRKEK